MPHIPKTTEPIEWHRYFAMEANNTAWKLAVQTRSAEDDLQMLSAAHAAEFHWNVVGIELNCMRAKMLLAEVHALLQLGATAYALASEVLAYFSERETPDWEMAFVYTIHAHAAYVTGNAETHRTSYANATTAIANIADEEDREIVVKTFSLVTAP